MNATERARAHLEWGWREEEVRADLASRGFSAEVIEEAMATVAEERAVETRVKGIRDVVGAGVFGAVALGVAVLMASVRHGGHVRGAAYLFAIGAGAGVLAIVLGVRGAMRLYRGRDDD